MRILVLGGSVFVGAAVTRAALAAGHHVTCLTRGLTGAVPEGADHVRGDRDDPDALTLLDAAAAHAGAGWDALVDVSSQPGRVRRAAAWLAERHPQAHEVYVSSGSVYSDPRTPDLTEDGPLLTPLAGDVAASIEDYGHAKVACEEAVRHAVGHTSVLRPGLIGGAGDASGRSGYWPWRLAHPASPDGRVLVPDAPDLPVQLVDVEDLAAFVVHVIESRITGTYNVVGDSVPFSAALDAAQEAAGVRRELVAVDGERLSAWGVSPWAGPRSLPLWLDDPAWTGFGARSSAAAHAVGLRPRPLAATFAAALRWHDGVAGVPASGLTDADERELLDRACRDHR